MIPRVKPGDELSLAASDWNQIADAVNAWQRPDLGLVGASGAAWGPQPVVVLLRNDTVFNLDRFSVLGLGDAIITPSDNLEAFQQQIALRGELPAASSHTGKFGILQAPIRSGDIGPAVITGATVCRLSGSTGQDYADVETNNTSELVTGQTGAARVVYEGADLGGYRYGMVIIGAGSSGCASQSAILDVSVLGSPTGGTFDIDLQVDGTTETMTFAYNATAAAVQTELETHTKIASGDVAVTGGPFADATMRITFQGNRANEHVAIPTADWSSLTGGGGVGVICAAAQLGFV